MPATGSIRPPTVGELTVVWATEFTGSRSWDGRDITEIDGVRVRLHWADQPHGWPAHAGPALVVVLDGIVEMHARSGQRGHVARLAPGDCCLVEAGTEYVAAPFGPARVLLIERKHSAGDAPDD